MRLILDRTGESRFLHLGKEYAQIWLGGRCAILCHGWIEYKIWMNGVFLRSQHSCVKQEMGKRHGGWLQSWMYVLDSGLPLTVYPLNQITPTFSILSGPLKTRGNNVSLKRLCGGPEAWNSLRFYLLPDEGRLWWQSWSWVGSGKTGERVLCRTHGGFPLCLKQNREREEHQARWQNRTFFLQQCTLLRARTEPGGERMEWCVGMVPGFGDSRGRMLGWNARLIRSQLDPTTSLLPNPGHVLSLLDNSTSALIQWLGEIVQLCHIRVGDPMHESTYYNT